MDSGIQLEQYSKPKLKTFNSHSIKASKITRWYCDICGKSLCSKRSHNDHMNIHKNARPFNCPNCHYSAASKNTLQRHFLRHHQSKEKWSYLCPYCPEMYVEAAGYRNHLKQKHHGYSGTFGCPFGDCKFSTMSASHFKDHILRHNPSYFEEGTTVKIDLSQILLKLYLVDDNFGKTIPDNLMVIENASEEEEEKNVVNVIPNNDDYFISKYGVPNPKYIIEKKTMSGIISNFTQNLPLPKRVLEDGNFSLLQCTSEIVTPNNININDSIEDEVKSKKILQTISYDNNKINDSHTSKKLKSSMSNDILKVHTTLKREKKVFKTVEGFIDEDIDDGEPIKKTDLSGVGSPVFLQKEKAFKTNEGTYDWDLD
ncbi:Zinc finger, C2H2 domain and Zinc finger C2H2-type/integrase DNA-binding domain and Zinc finger, C2H2-like domain-containing protein [Strongyloides ratti]|uniref:Zinc finger, C2H2 domain and Zinc finger C2H2-type/integrase DNA-binding domain and Zinc finger, C2H2-like domain-containing protein n=1 Tax=Strongyloides ratti TaxID=34506 RepID=A0A090KXJ2_STRRB|nr:Zinc finger, C2H2 domain and Zinc finger C2H2-type/integrase DNA-binding domain and Zinc finger, C2H2-like domain-containing protein [Strongyloides ratti]CEF62190.1 Zinc finger, C2H2 domain and Zinc finger C2H2-type/integrase DNA-binding domain and Zinc finger, C2H2-like domain-containing protein [Strongyloides ratti]